MQISTPLGIEPGSLMTGSKWVTHWTSETVYECSEIVGSPQYCTPVEIEPRVPYDGKQTVDHWTNGTV
jgi:hypothetical protein